MKLELNPEEANVIHGLVCDLMFHINLMIKPGVEKLGFKETHIWGYNQEEQAVMDRLKEFIASNLVEDV